MNIERLQVGTKVKVLQSLYTPIPSGSIGYVVVGSFRHQPGKILDEDGDVWVRFSRLQGRYCFKLKGIKILCYKPKEIPTWVSNANDVED